MATTYVERIQELADEMAALPRSEDSHVAADAVLVRALDLIYVGTEEERGQRQRLIDAYDALPKWDD